MEITKQDILDSIKEELLDRISEDFYEWVFEDNGNDVCAEFSKRLVDGVIHELSSEFKNNLISEMKLEIVQRFLDSEGRQLYWEIKKDIQEIVKQVLLDKFEVNICKK